MRALVEQQRDEMVANEQKLMAAITACDTRKGELMAKLAAVRGGMAMCDRLLSSEAPALPDAAPDAA